MNSETRSTSLAIWSRVKRITDHEATFKSQTTNYSSNTLTFLFPTLKRTYIWSSFERPSITLSIERRHSTKQQTDILVMIRLIQTVEDEIDHICQISSYCLVKRIKGLFSAITSTERQGVDDISLHLQTGNMLHAYNILFFIVAVGAKEKNRDYYKCR